MRHPSIHFETDPAGRSVATVVGEVDSATAPFLRRELLASSSPEVIDLRFVSLLSAAGVSVLLEAFRRRPYRTVGSTVVERVLRVLELDQMLDLVHPDGAPALDTAPFGVAVHDHDLRFVYVNEALATINGLPASEHLHRHPAQLFDVEHDDISSVIRAVGTTHHPRQIRVSGATATGRTASWRCCYRPARYVQDGEPCEVVIATVKREAVSGVAPTRLSFDARV
ncbi:PAS domain-containing protein [Ilumatobacter nonamiensis]|uniref:PAS domain-containing protein n=1 Tax=Ilumatobacter nonamiensis TaxID=467093 RepID=UPI0003496602|nr:PAS domain-containing protein [Ilumatobacter nonamiensis]